MPDFQIPYWHISLKNCTFACMFRKWLIGCLFLLAFHPAVAVNNATEPENEKSVLALYEACQVKQVLSFDVFKKAVMGRQRFGIKQSLVAICDFTKPSTEKRFFVIDLVQKKLLIHSWVAHGRNTGDNEAKYFSNTPSSLKSSKGFFSIGSQIMSPKHGIALLLEGLQKGLNDKAKQREIIIHGAHYVSETFIKQYGRLGRSFGCPALSDEVMKTFVPLAANGGLLYIHAKGL